MSSTQNTSRLAALIAFILFLLAGSWGVYQMRKVDSMQSALDADKLAKESLLSEKLALQKQIEKTHSQMKALEDEKSRLDRQLSQNEATLQSRQAEYDRIKREAASNRKKYNDLDALKKQLEQELFGYNSTIQQLKAENADLNNSMASLKQQNQNLLSQLDQAHTAYYDQPLLEATRGKNDKLMVKAKRASKMKATIMVPGNLKDLQFKIVAPDGSIISNPEFGTVASRIVQDNVNLTSSSSSSTSGTAYNKVEMTFLPKKKLQAGVYKIEVLSEHLSVGNLQMRLR